MARIFISYRRADSIDQTGRVYDRLIPIFSRENIFKDIDSVPAGSDFRRIIEDAIEKADLVLVVIGKLWLNSVDDAGNRRLNDRNDFVRLEIESALRQKKLIIPVLVHGAVMPKAETLPESLSDLTFRHAVAIRSDPDFHRDTERLIAAIKRSAAEERRKRRSTATRKRLKGSLKLWNIICAIAITLTFYKIGCSDRGGGVPDPKEVVVSPPFEPLPFPQAPSKVIPITHNVTENLPGGKTVQTPKTEFVRVDGTKANATESTEVLPSPQSPSVVIPAPAPEALSHASDESDIPTPPQAPTRVIPAPAPALQAPSRASDDGGEVPPPPSSVGGNGAEPPPALACPKGDR